MIDQALVGSLVTGFLGLLGVCCSKMKCFVRCLPDDENWNQACGCGFTDSRLLPNESRLETHEIRENDLLVIKKG